MSTRSLFSTMNVIFIFKTRIDFKNLQAMFILDIRPEKHSEEAEIKQFPLIRRAYSLRPPASA